VIFKCWWALKKLNTRKTPTIPTEISKKVDQQNLSVPTYKYLKPEQLKKWLSESPENETIANGLSYRTVDGSLTVLFWPNNKNPNGATVTHRDAIESVIRSELRAIENYLSNPRNEKLELLLDAKANLSAILDELKNNEQIPKDLTERFFGFQIRAKLPLSAAEVQIESIDFIPSLSGKPLIGPMFGWTEEFQAMINQISKSISPKSRPQMYRLDESIISSQWGPLKVKAPTGSQITGFSDK